MKKHKLLSELYQKYVNGELERKDLEGSIFLYLRDNFDRYNIFFGNQDRWREFLSWVYPRLVRAIDMYQDFGSSFDAYVVSIVRCTSREYRCREEDHKLTEYACWTARARETEEIMALENEPEYSEYPKNFIIPEDLKWQQILFLILKAYYFVNEEIVKQASRIIDMDSKIIWFLIEKIRILRSGNDDRIFGLRERLYGQYYRCLAYQKRMEAALPGTMYREKMKGRFERAQKRYSAMKKRLGGKRLAASNRMIADVLGVPKGTVDTGISAIKRRLRYWANEAV